MAQAWQAKSNHPLMGRVFKTRGRVSVGSGGVGVGEPRLGTIELLQNVLAANVSAFASGAAPGTAPIYIFGEIHDNDAHHAFRAQIAPKAAATDGKRAAAYVFEQFGADSQAALDSFAEKARASAMTLADFKSAVAWDKSPWSKENYDPLFQSVVDHKLPAYAGDVTPAMMMKAARKGATALPTDDMARLKLDAPLGEKLDNASLTEIEGAHCGMMPKSAFAGMAFAQRYRDAHLADVAIKAADTHGQAVLLVGNTHARTDRGVAWYVRQRNPERSVISIMLVEIDEGQTDPEVYVPRDPDGKPAADFLVFTPAVARPDPCADMRAKMKKPG